MGYPSADGCLLRLSETLTLGPLTLETGLGLTDRSGVRRSGLRVRAPFPLKLSRRCSSIAEHRVGISETSGRNRSPAPIKKAEEPLLGPRAGLPAV